MSGIYLWTTDIGGFRDGNTLDPIFRQLIVRWFQFGAFCPIFRLHGDRGGPKDKDKCGSYGHNEVWEFGDEAYAAITDVMRSRHSLLVCVHVAHRHMPRVLSPHTTLMLPPVGSLSPSSCVVFYLVQSLSLPFLSPPSP